MDKYAIINPSEINHYHKLGFDFVTVFYENINSGGGMEHVSGNFMNNPINLNLPVGEFSIRNAKFLMIRNQASEVLYGNTK